MQTQDIVEATDGSPNLVLARSGRVLSARPAPTDRLERAISPLYGIRWADPVVKAYGSRRLNRILDHVRDSEIPLKIYNSIDSLLREAPAGDPEFPP